MRLRTLALTVAALSALTTSPATASPLDFAAATTQTATDHFDAFNDSMASPSPANVTCSMPIVYGAELVPHADLIFAETRQTDEVFAAATCASLTGAYFEASVEVRIEYCSARTSLTTCTMSWTGFSDTGRAVALTGTAAPVVELTAVYPAMHAAVGRPRRVHACVRTTLSGTRCVTRDYSGVYGV